MWGFCVYNNLLCAECLAYRYCRVCSFASVPPTLASRFVEPALGVHAHMSVETSLVDEQALLPLLMKLKMFFFSPDGVLLHFDKRM